MVWSLEEWRQASDMERRQQFLRYLVAAGDMAARAGVKELDIPNFIAALRDLYGGRDELVTLSNSSLRRAADRIKETRHKMGISQEELGRLLGVSQCVVSRWERGCQTPSPAQLRELEELERQVRGSGNNLNESEQTRGKEPGRVSRGYTLVSSTGRGLRTRSTHS